MNPDDRVFTKAIERIQVWPLDHAIARRSCSLDFSGDPADEIIAATSIIHKVPLLTRDKTMLGSNMVPLAVS